MSGGHFNYRCHEITEFAGALKKEIDANENSNTDKYGATIGYNFNPKTMQRIISAHRIIETAGKLAREIEWLYSDDHDEKSFNELADAILIKFTKTLERG